MPHPPSMAVELSALEELLQVWEIRK